MNWKGKRKMYGLNCKIKRNNIKIRWIAMKARSKNKRRKFSR